jgi:hypothetical protein
VSDPLGQDQEDYLAEPGGPLDPGGDEQEHALDPADDPPYFEEN